jgi:hypothetical protein
MITLVINLDQSKARLEAFKAANSPVLRDIVRIQAVDGQQLTDKWHHLSRWMHLTHEPSKFNIIASYRVLPVAPQMLAICRRE